MKAVFRALKRLEFAFGACGRMCEVDGGGEDCTKTEISAFTTRSFSNKKTRLMFEVPKTGGINAFQ